MVWPMIGASILTSGPAGEGPGPEPARFEPLKEPQSARMPQISTAGEGRRAPEASSVATRGRGARSRLGPSGWVAAPKTAMSLVFERSAAADANTADARAAETDSSGLLGRDGELDVNSQVGDLPLPA